MFFKACKKEKKYLRLCNATEGMLGDFNEMVMRVRLMSWVIRRLRGMRWRRTA